MKKLSQLLLILLVVISLSCQTSFPGNEKVKILDNFNEISSLEELINLPEFKDKILFINLYSFYCDNSVDEFPHLKKLQQHIQESSNIKREVAYIHISTPKWASERFWRSNVEQFDLPGYHFLMNKEFQNDFWSHFPEEQRATPFFIEVTNEKEILKKSWPSTMFKSASLNTFQFRIFKFVEDNLDSVVSKHPKNFDLLFKYDRSSEHKISFFRYSKNNSDSLVEVDVWEGLKVFTEKSFDSIPNNNSLSEYTFAIPLNARTLDSIIPD